MAGWGSRDCGTLDSARDSETERAATPDSLENPVAARYAHCTHAQASSWHSPLPLGRRVGLEWCGTRSNAGE